MNTRKNATGTVALLMAFMAAACNAADINAQQVPYKWFRLSIAATKSGKATVRIRQIGLYDADGIRQNGTLQAIDGCNAINSTNLLANLAVPGPGQVNYDKSMEGMYIAVGNQVGSNASDGLEASFNENYYQSSPSWHVSLLKRSGGSYEIVSANPGNPQTWIRIVMHLPASANPICRFDIQRHMNYGTDSATRMRMEGSLDGENWDILWSNIDVYTSPEIVYSGASFNRWMSDNSDGSSNKTRPSGTGYELSSSTGVAKRYFSWFRMSFAKLGNSPSPESYTLAIRQIGLFDRDGIRQNSHLRALLGPSPTVARHNAYIAGEIGVGEVGYDPSASGKMVEIPVADGCGAEEFQASFVDIFKTTSITSSVWRMSWYDSNGVGCPPDPADRSTWIPLVMHLREPVEITHFDIQSFSRGDATTRATWPSRILLEGSCDGRNWWTVFNNATTGDEFDYSSRGGSEYDAAKHNMSNMWLSDGCTAIGRDVKPNVDPNAHQRRIYGEGWALARTELGPKKGLVVLFH